MSGYFTVLWEWPPCRQWTDKCNVFRLTVTAYSHRLLLVNDCLCVCYWYASLSSECSPFVNIAYFHVVVLKRKVTVACVLYVRMSYTLVYNVKMLWMAAIAQYTVVNVRYCCWLIIVSETYQWLRHANSVTECRLSVFCQKELMFIM